MRMMLCAFTVFTAFTAVAPAASATKPPDHKITICHRTDSNTNPYVVITVDVASTRFAGHEGHDGPVWNPSLKANHVKWGDIIPPTSNDGTRAVTPKNWPTGASILRNGCKVPGEQTTTTTTTVPGRTTTTTAPGTTTTQPDATTTTQPREDTTTTAPNGPATTTFQGSATRRGQPGATGELAFTGGETELLGVVALLSLLGGSAALAHSRRKVRQ